MYIIKPVIDYQVINCFPQSLWPVAATGLGGYPVMVIWVYAVTGC